MAKKNLISPPSPRDTSGTSGVDLSSSPLSLGNQKLRSAVNLQFDEGTIKTRPGFHYQKLEISGQFQGLSTFAPSRGLMHLPQGQQSSALVLVVNGKAYLFDSTHHELRCGGVMCGDYCFADRGPVNVYQAENYLVFQNRFSNTFYWAGYNCLEPSPGMSGCVAPDGEDEDSHTVVWPNCETSVLTSFASDTSVPPGTTSLTSQPLTGTGGSAGVTPGETTACPKVIRPEHNAGTEGQESPHDSFCEDRHTNWLINGAGLGIYVHGRIHQEGHYMIYVSDLVGKRGPLATDDLLKMEEQALQSMGDPLATNSKMGALLALAVMPSMNTANGEGDLIAYYENGVVAYDTFKFPRETRANGAGEFITKGWDTQRLVNHLLNMVSAVGRYSVASLPRDHFFRSTFGLHFLKTALGEGSFNPEHLNLLSRDVQPILDLDLPDTLPGSACGHWTKGGRLFTTVGMTADEKVSATSFGRGFLSYNQASGFTEDRTPRATWEGLWLPDHEVAGIHAFTDLALRPSERCYGFIASDQDQELLFASIAPTLREDFRDEEWIPIEWSLETGQSSFGSHAFTNKLSEAVLEGRFDDCSQRVRVLVRTDLKSEWALWHEFAPGEKRKATDGGLFHRSEPLGQPPAGYTTATWFQVRIEGIGYAEILSLTADVTESGGKNTGSRCVGVSVPEDDFFVLNREAPDTRWPAK